MSKLIWILAALLLLAPFCLGLSMLQNSKPQISYDREAYREKIAIEALFAGRGTAGEQAGLPLVWFRLRNKGSHTVNEVRVHVNFLNRQGDIVHEADFYPVHSGEYGAARVKPLGPGDVWEMAAVRYYMPTGVPHTWEPGSVTARVESIRFENE